MKTRVFDQKTQGNGVDKGRWRVVEVIFFGAVQFYEFLIFSKNVKIGIPIEK